MLTLRVFTQTYLYLQMKTDQSLSAQTFLDKNIFTNCSLLINDLLLKNQRNWNIESDAWFQDLFLQEDLESREEYISSGLADHFIEPDFFREHFEFYIVSDYFAARLKERDALLTNHWNFWIWGRETTGQNIILDYVFQDIWQSTPAWFSESN